MPLVRLTSVMKYGCYIDSFNRKLKELVYLIMSNLSRSEECILLLINQRRMIVNLSSNNIFLRDIMYAI
jgi:hypothetical protein